MTEHEKSRDRRVRPAALGLCGGAYAAQEVTVSKLVPGVSVVGEPVALSVGAHGRKVVLANAYSRQGPAVLALVSSVAHHPLGLLVAAEVVTRVVASERAFRVVVEVDGAQSPVGARNCYLDDGYVVVGECLYVGVGEHVLAYLLRIVHGVPEVIEPLVRVLDAHGAQRRVGQLLDAEQDDTTRAVGKGRVGLPEAAWETPCALFTSRRSPLRYAANFSNMATPRSRLTQALDADDRGHRPSPAASRSARAGRPRPNVPSCQALCQAALGCRPRTGAPASYRDAVAGQGVEGRRGVCST